MKKLLLTVISLSAVYLVYWYVNTMSTERISPDKIVPLSTSTPTDTSRPAQSPAAPLPTTADENRDKTMAVPESEASNTPSGADRQTASSSGDSFESETKQRNSDTVEADQQATDNPAAVYDIDLKTSLESLQFASFNAQRQYLRERNNIFTIARQEQQPITLHPLLDNPFFDFETSVTNLNVAEQGQQAAPQNATEVSYRLGHDSSAFLVNLKGILPLSEYSSIFAKVGFNSWKVDASQLNGYEDHFGLSANSLNNVANPVQGVDMFYGIGYQFKYDDYVFSSELSVYDIEGLPVDVFSIGATFKF
ncbi:hypothetical protein QWY77_06880 [Thalassotalea ponticola]|uniref:hypothetical protein n=1 Tax=Thalassotalea ponticola TaxID=1523392 RepID=UPI0025B621D5|nr:hypothetical protein [Thalassotalea ponticola]MDN3652487.1 hypothetical protein [Thalassotalea ponticola]